MTDIPPFPALSDRAAGSYNGMAFAFGTHMAEKFNDEIVAVAGSAVANATEAAGHAEAASESAQSAETAAQAAAQAAGANPWVSGTTYAKNVAVISQANFQAYRRMVAGAGTTDPANDTGAIWMPLFGNGSFTVGANSPATFDLAARNFFTRAMSVSETWAFTNCPTNGFSFGVELAYTGGTLALPTSVKSPNNIVYSFTAGKTYLLLFITANKGTRWRMAVTEAYDN